MDESKGIISEFKDFVLRGNVVDLAVAVVIGVAFAAVVTALVEDLITPLIAAIAGESDFSRLTFTINGSHFLYGDFINAVVSFVWIAAAVFFLVVKPINFVTARRKAARAAGGEPAPESLSDEALLLAEIRDLLRRPRNRRVEAGLPLSPTAAARKRRSRRLFETTNTLDSAIAAPAITGLSNPAAASGSAHRL